jgi:hypothetical protein
MGVKHNSWRRYLVPISVVLALIWSLVRVGPAFLPDLPGFVAKFGSWSQINLAPTEVRFRVDLLHQWIYEFTGSRGVEFWLLEATFFSLVALALMIYIASGEGRASSRGRGARLAILSPALALFIGFLGSYDGLTASLQLLIVLGWLRNWRWLMVSAGVLLGLHHPEQGLLSLVALLLTLLALRPASRVGGGAWAVSWGIVGIVGGKLIAAVVLYIATSSAAGSRPLDLLPRIDNLKSTIDFSPAIVLSCFAGLWVVVILVWLVQDRRGKALLLSGFIFCLVVAGTDMDKTRIFTLVALPSLIILIRWFVDSDCFTRRELLLAESLAWIVPPILVWQDSLGMGQIQHLGWIDQFVMSWQMMMGW